MNDKKPTFSEIQNNYHKVQELSHKYWVHDSLFSFNWWFIVSLTFIMWAIWFKFVNRAMLVEILLGGCLISLVTLLLDLTGLNMNLWDYPTLVIYSFYPTLLPVDIVVIPVTYMFLYQFHRTWKMFFLMSVVVSGVYSFVAEPIFNLMDIYRLKHWHYYYSFPIYIVLFVFVRWFVLKVKAISQN